jgi:hypothetical protein
LNQVDQALSAAGIFVRGLLFVCAEVDFFGQKSGWRGMSEISKY